MPTNQKQGMHGSYAGRKNYQRALDEAANTSRRVSPATQEPQNPLDKMNEEFKNQGLSKRIRDIFGK